jgi:hypothetical protein
MLFYRLGLLRNKRMESNPISERVDGLSTSEEIKAEIKDALLSFSSESDFLQMFRNRRTIIEVQLLIKDIFQHISEEASWEIFSLLEWTEVYFQ